MANESAALTAKYSKTGEPGEAATQPRIGQWPTIGSHPIFACQFRGRYCAVDNAPIITLNGDHSYAHSAGFKPPFRIHYRRAAQIIAPMRAASSFFQLPRPAGGIDHRSIGSSAFRLMRISEIVTRFVQCVAFHVGFFVAWNTTRNANICEM